MTDTVLYLMRHGQSLSNAGIAAVDRVNVLSATGVRQALAAGTTLINAGITRIVSSDLPRAVQTALCTASAMALPTELLLAPELRELDHFAEEVWYTSDEMAARFGADAYDAFVADADRRLEPGAENQRDVYARAVPYLRERIVPLLGAGPVLVVSHYFVLRAFAAALDGRGADAMPSYHFANAAPQAYTAAAIARSGLGRVCGAAGAEPSGPTRFAA